MDLMMDLKVKNCRQIWLFVLERVKADLIVLNSPKETLLAAIFVFAVPDSDDVVGSFDWICSLLNKNPDFAAREIFESLTQLEQKRILSLLNSAGFSVNFSIRHKSNERPRILRRLVDIRPRGLMN